MPAPPSSTSTSPKQSSSHSSTDTHDQQNSKLKRRFVELEQDSGEDHRSTERSVRPREDQDSLVGETRRTEQTSDPARSRPASPTQPIASTSSPRILRSPRARSSLPANHKTTACEGDPADGPVLTSRSTGPQGQSEPSTQARLRDEGSRDGRRSSKRPLSQSSPGNATGGRAHPDGDAHMEDRSTSMSKSSPTRAPAWTEIKTGEFSDGAEDLKSQLAPKPPAKARAPPKNDSRTTKPLSSRSKSPRKAPPFKEGTNSGRKGEGDEDDEDDEDELDQIDESSVAMQLAAAINASSPVADKSSLRTSPKDVEMTDGTATDEAVNYSPASKATADSAPTSSAGAASIDILARAAQVVAESPEPVADAQPSASLESIVRVAEAAVAAQDRTGPPATSSSTSPSTTPSLVRTSDSQTSSEGATTPSTAEKDGPESTLGSDTPKDLTSPTSKSPSTPSSLAGNPYASLLPKANAGVQLQPLMMPYPIFYPSPTSNHPNTPITPNTPPYPIPFNPYYYLATPIMPGMYPPPPPGFMPIPAPRQGNQDATLKGKSKRLKSHAITTKSINIPVVPRDKKGHPMLPLNVGIMTVIKLGDVCMREHFHTERYIFPVGYEVTRRYLSTLDPNIEVVYHCTILDGGDGPKFQIIPSDRPDKPVIAGTATGAWSSIVKQANAIRNRQHSNSVSGPDFFGLGQNTIKHLIQELPNANRLRDYVWQNFVEGGPLGGRHAAVIPALPEEYDNAVPLGPYYPKRDTSDPNLPRGMAHYPQHIIAQAEAERASKQGAITPQMQVQQMQMAGPSGLGQHMHPHPHLHHQHQHLTGHSPFAPHPGAQIHLPVQLSPDGIPLHPQMLSSPDHVPPGSVPTQLQMHMQLHGIQPMPGVPSATGVAQPAAGPAASTPGRDGSKSGAGSEGATPHTESAASSSTSPAGSVASVAAAAATTIASLMNAYPLRPQTNAEGDAIS